MNKFIQIMKSTWAEYMTYRLNFILWRMRVVMQLLVVYFLWSALLGSQITPEYGSGNSGFFGFTGPMILSYIVLTGLVRTFVLGTTTMEIGSIINQGDLSNFLLRPYSFFTYYAARDAADKILNLAFAVLEVGLILIILRPSVYIQSNPVILGFTVLSLIIGVVIYFFFSMLLSFLGFWTPDVWAPRFLSFVIIEFFAGGLFPLDILPKPLYTISQSLPFSYFLYLPLKIYIGQLDTISVVTKLLSGCIWIILFWAVTVFVWKRGLRVYSAEGR